MRPIRLQVQGLTAYRQPVEVDFTELDLFAISGPTGAGKSSLVDAMTFALFGQMPGVGRNVKDLISLGEERLKVSLEFSANGGRYRIMRSTARRGAALVQLERFDPAADDWVPEEDRVREATLHIEQLLGMDYDGFVRSVLLPQGQFHQFLTGEPQERQKVLDGLLRLDIYKLMAQKANELLVLNSREAEGIRQQLETHLADATEEALAEARRQLQQLAQRAQCLQGDRAALDAGCRVAEELSRQRKASSKAEGALADAEAKLAKASELLESGQKLIDVLASKQQAIERRIEANTYDAELHNRLSRALDLVQQAEKTAGRVEQLQKQLKAGKQTLAQAETADTQLAAALAEAQAVLAVAEAAREETHRHDLAATLRHGLKTGDPCPVCGHKLGALPLEEHLAIAAAEAVLREAKTAEVATRQKASETGQQLALTKQKIETLERQAAEAEADCAGQRRQLEALLAGQPATAKEIAAAVNLQETARRERESLLKESRELTAQAAERTKQMVEAGQSVTALQIEAANQRQAMEAATSAIAAAEVELQTASREHGWEEIMGCLAEGDASAALRARLERLHGELAEVQRDSGACEQRIERIQVGIEKAKELREREKAARQAAGLARDLATLLRVDRFQAFVRGRALALLAEDGSRRLQEISSGRYEFAVEGQEFLVLDRWNGGEMRSVKTLSGGESFLASLSLALALAERLPGLGAGGHGHTLESLFIDEGFSYLDVETLDVVASALEVLGGSGDRLVGVITHLPALAERMPARITVVKSPAGSTLTID